MATTPTTFPEGHSARILAFPIRDRVATMASREQKFAMMEAVARRYAGVASASAWYHEEAAAEDGEARH